jgi:hypothetical protein
MNIVQYDLRSRGGYLITDPVILGALDRTLLLQHSMDRPPDVAFIRLTCTEADSGWLPGETHDLYNPGSSTPNFYIEKKPGSVLGFIWASSLYVPSQASNANSTVTVTSWRVQLGAVWYPPILANL